METGSQNSISETVPVLKIFGIGNAGIALLNALSSPEFSAAQFCAVNTDASSLAASSAPVKIHLENKLLRGLGSGGDPDRARALGEEQFSFLKSACDGADIIFILAGLGGGAGSGIAPVMARAAREAGALVLVFVTLPFDCEGNRRESQARQSLEQIKSAADGVICLPGQKISKLIDENMGVVETFRLMSQFLAEGIRGVGQLLNRPGLIQVHFADLCALLRDRHSESAFAFVEAAGPARARETIEKLLAHPLLDAGRVLAESDAILVSLMAGKDLTMAEVNRVMEQMKLHCGRAQIIMGASVDATLKNKLCVTVIAAKNNSTPAQNNVSRNEINHGGRNGSGPREAIIGRAVRGRHANSKMVQSQLPLSVVSKSRFDKSEPTLHHGEDLDIPTFLRRGVALN
jgi:cell division protein FtsZ